MIKHLLVIPAVLSGLFGFGSAADAHGRWRRSCAEVECCQSVCQTPCPPQWVERTVTCFRPEWREREVKCTVNRVIPRQVMTQQKCVVMVPTWHEEKRMITVFKYVPRTTEREVVTCHKVRVCEPSCDDGCGRCCRPRCHREWVQEVCKVPCTVWTCVPEQREVVASVCSYVPQEQTYQVCRIVCEVKPETIVHKECFCVMVPYQVKVKVPACCP
jgi:hypothetical protein